MVDGTVKGRAFPSRSKCEALTLMRADSEPSKSSMKEFAASPLDGEGEINKVQNKQCIDGEKVYERFCGPAVHNVIEVDEKAVLEGNDEERDILDEMKLKTSDFTPTSGKMQGCLEEVNDGDAIAYNTGGKNIEEVIVKDNETVLYGLDIKYPNIGEERKILEMATNNIVDEGLTSEFQITGESLTDNPQTEKEDNEMHTDVPIDTNIGIESVICGLEITNPNIREERKNLEVATDNHVHGGLAARALQITGDYLTDKSQNEEEANKLKTDVPLGTNLDNERVFNGVDIKDAVVREERKCLEMGTDNTIDRTLPAPELQIACSNLTDNLQNKEEANRLMLEVAVGSNLDNETVACEVDIKDAAVEEEIKSLDMAADNMVDGVLLAPELRVTGINLMDCLKNDKQDNRLKSEVAMATNLRNETLIYGVDIIDANTTKDNIVDGGLTAASELKKEGKNLTYNPHDEKEANKLNSDVPMVVYGVDIKDAVVREERKSLEMMADSMVGDHALPSLELQIAGKKLTENGEKSNRQKSEVAMGANLDNETVGCEVDIKDAIVREERKSLEMATTDNMVDGALPAPELQITSENLMDSLQNDKEANRLKTEVAMGISLHNGTVIYREDITDANTREDGKANKLNTEVQMGTNSENETVVCGVDIKDAVVREEKESLEMTTDNTVLPVPELQVRVQKLMDSLQNEKESTRLKLEEAMGSNLDSETVAYLVDVKKAVVRFETNSLEMATDNMADNETVPARELQMTGTNLMDSLQNEKKDNRLKNEVALGTNLHNGVGISNTNTRDVGKSLNMITDNIVDGGFNASEGQVEGNNVTYNSHNEKESNKLNTDVDICTNLDNGKMECGSVDVSVACNLKASSNNVSIPKRRRLNRKMFEKTIFENNEATLNNAKPQFSIGNDPCIGHNADMNMCVRTDNNAETKPLVNIGRKMNRLRRKQVPQGHAGTSTANDEQKSQLNNDEQKVKVNKETEELDMKHENAEDSLRIEKECGEPERTKKLAVGRSKSSKRVDIAGMIFMCNSETKEDCFNLRILALPACKGYIVSKIYKGMRLFLFDCELKIMHGIYKAACPGGYNIDPLAFKSKFPSQVRFTVVEDCIPLAEENFRSVIKDNYYTKHKFHCQLTHEQVKNLCRLFHYNSKISEFKLGIRIGNTTTTQSPVQHDKKRKRVEDSKRQSAKGVRRDSMIVSQSYEHDTLYEREAYAQPSTPPTVYEPLPPRDTLHISSHSYNETMVMDMHRRDLALDHDEPSLYNCHVPYARYVDADAYDAPVYEYIDREYETSLTHAYPEPAYESHSFRQPNYETGIIHDYRVPTHVLQEPTHVLQEPTHVLRESTHAYPHLTHELGVSRPFQGPMYQELGCELMDANKVQYGYSSGRQQVEYYGNGQYHDRPPLSRYHIY